jgi:hypothetical protein
MEQVGLPMIAADADNDNDPPNKDTFYSKGKLTRNSKQQQYDLSTSNKRRQIEMERMRIFKAMGMQAVRLVFGSSFAMGTKVTMPLINAVHNPAPLTATNDVRVVECPAELDEITEFMEKRVRIPNPGMDFQFESSCGGSKLKITLRLSDGKLGRDLDQHRARNGPLPDMLPGRINAGMLDPPVIGGNVAAAAAVFDWNAANVAAIAAMPPLGKVYASGKKFMLATNRRKYYSLAEVANPGALQVK